MVSKKKKRSRALRQAIVQEKQPTAVSAKAESAIEPDNAWISYSADFKRAQACWQVGDWEGLVALSDDALEDSHQRVDLALMVAVAASQLGYSEKSRMYVGKALEWGASREQVGKVLLSGAYNTLGCATLLAGPEYQSKGGRYLSESARLALGDGAVPSMVRARAREQFEQVQGGQLNRNTPQSLFLAEPKQDEVSLANQRSKLTGLKRLSELPDLTDFYELDEEVGIYQNEGAEIFDYSDGDEVENRLLNLVRQAEDVSLFSPELRDHQTDWPSEYHLSADRANLLRPFAQKLADSQVLELGCGCGAVTRYLGELGASVTAVEGSSRRAAITASRCRDLPNVQVAVDKLEAFPLGRQFDVVTLIGVLEYSRVFVEAADPIQFVLQRAREYLKPDGILIVAIENQLGLKYFAGAPEDHGVGVMAGVNDLYTDQSPVTFGRHQLEQRVRKAGFSRVETFSPFPDYKLPNLVIAPDAAKRAPECWNLGTLLASSVSVDRQGVRNSFFSLRRAWPLVAENQLVADLANSHLLVAYCQPEGRVVNDQSLAFYYSPRRGATASQEVEFRSNHSSEHGISVRRRNLANTQVTATDEGWQIEGYQPGDIHSDQLQAVVQRPGWPLEMVCEWARPWIRALEKSVLSDQSLRCIPEAWSHFRQWLPPEFLDAAPRNLVMKPDGSTSWIDLEWVHDHPLSLEFVIFRGLFVTFHGVRTVAVPDNDELLDANVLLHRVMAFFGYSASSADIYQFAGVIRDIAHRAEGRPCAQDSASLDSVKLPVWSTRAIKHTLTADCTVYWRKSDQGFEEARSVHYPLVLDGGRHSFNLQLSEAIGEDGELRLDIANRPGLFLVEVIELLAPDGDRLWQWQHDQEAIADRAQMKLMSAQESAPSVFLSEGTDPQCILRMPAAVKASIENGASLRLVVTSTAIEP